MEIKVKKLVADAVVPTKAYPADAGLDLYSIDNAMLKPGSIIKVHTGIAVSIPEGYYGQIHDRSGLASRGIKVFGGVIDSSYRGEIIVILGLLETFERVWQPVAYGQKIAQLVILPVPEFTLTEVADLEDTDRGVKGFGSSG